MKLDMGLLLRGGGTQFRPAKEKKLEEGLRDLLLLLIDAFGSLLFRPAISLAWGFRISRLDRSCAKIKSYTRPDLSC